MSGFWSSLAEAVRPRMIRERQGLAGLVSREAAVIAQKCPADYCRAKAGMNQYKLFEEAAFKAAMDVCRWESFPAAAADLLIVCEGVLRGEATGAAFAQLEAGLNEVYRAILREYPAPAHRGGDGWAADEVAFAARLDQVRQEPVRKPVEIAHHTARRMYETLPIHASLRDDEDREFIFGAVQFTMVAAWETLLRRADWRAIAADLSG